MTPLTIGKLSWLQLLVCRSARAQHFPSPIATNNELGTSRYLRKDVLDSNRDGSSNDINHFPPDILNIDLLDQRTSSSSSTTVSATTMMTKTSASTKPPLEPAAAVFQVSECNTDEVLWSFVLVTDDYAYESSWELKNAAGEILAFGPPNGTNYDRANRYVGNMCLAPGEYLLTIRDKMGDGNCCEFGQGSFSVAINGVVLVESDGSPFSVKELPFLIQPESLSSPSPSPSTSSPSLSYSSQRPTDLPILPPTSQIPTMAPTRNQPISNRTSAPFSSLTVSPTISSLESLSKRNSMSPSHVPSMRASGKPSEMPSSTSTETSSISPNVAKSEEPSATPTKAPFRYPTTAPSTSQTKSPTDLPTAASPNALPTSFPGESTTASPSTSSTVSSSASPSLSSSTSPTTVSPVLPARTISDPPTLGPSQPPSITSILPSIEASSIPPSIIPSLSPSVSSSGSPTAVPLKSFTPPSVTFDFSNVFPATQEPTQSPSANPTPIRVAVAISPFNLYMEMGGGSEDPNIEELDDILSKHLLRHMQAKPITSQAAKVNIYLNKISSMGRQLQEIVMEDVDFAVQGNVYFIGNITPTTEEIDEVNRESFDAENGIQFVYALQNAKDPALQSIKSISTLFSTNTSNNFEENYLRNEKDRSQGSANNALYILIVVFFVGILLVAVFVHRTRVERRNQRGGFPDVERNENSLDDESAPSLPTYIDVMPTRSDQFSTSHRKIHVVGERKDGESVGYGNYCDTMTEVESKILPHIDSEESNREINPFHFSNVNIQTIKEDEEAETGFLCGIANKDDEACVTTERKRVVQNDWGVNPTGSEDSQSMHNSSMR